MTAIFAQQRVAFYDGFTEIPGGWLDGHWLQLPWHIADSAAGLTYSFGMTVSKTKTLLFIYIHTYIYSFLFPETFFPSYLFTFLTPCQ